MRLRNKIARKVYTLGEDVHIAHTEGGRIEVEIVLESGGFAREYFDSLAEFNGEWEDVKEPLIKDEKIRKAVRAWYELFDENRLGQFEDGKYIAVGYREFVIQTLDTSLTYTFELPFIDGMQSLKQRWGLGADYYTITELCGDEE